MGSVDNTGNDLLNQYKEKYDHLVKTSVMFSDDPEIAELCCRKAVDLLILIDTINEKL